MNQFAEQKQRHMQRTNLWTPTGESGGGGWWWWDELGDWD